MKKIAIIGGGAAGCFCAVALKRLRPDTEVCVYEAGARPMAKLALTGGGKCNISNSFEEIRSLKEVYPRGHRLMERLFHQFSPEDTAEWWESEGIRLVTLEGGRIFPECMDAGEIVGKLRALMDTQGVKLICRTKVEDISGLDADAVIVTTGGGNDAFLSTLGVETVPGVPSLFSLRIDCPELKVLSGLSVKNASLCLEGSGIHSHGDILITDWGLSGPAVLKLSSYAARELAARNYKGRLIVNWCGQNEGLARETVSSLLNSRKLLASVHSEQIPARLWSLIISRSGLREDIRCNEVGTKGFSKFVSALISDTYEIAGKNRFKEEFVTCGGVSLSCIKQDTLESKEHPGLFFAGEALDLDAVTGGFNLQAAWTTAMVAARGAALRAGLI